MWKLRFKVKVWNQLARVEKPGLPSPNVGAEAGYLIHSIIHFLNCNI